MIKKSKKNNEFYFVLIIFAWASLAENCQSNGVKNINQKITNTCIFSKDIYSDYEIIISDSINTLIKNSGDSCNFKLLDSLTANFIKNTDSKSYCMLRNLSIYSDGYLSDYFVEKLNEIYNQSFLIFFENLYSDNEKGIKGNLDKLLVECWSSIAADSDNPNIDIQKICEKTRNDVMKSKVNIDARLKYLNTLLKIINPTYLD